MGDIVLTTPVLRCLKTQRDDIELHYLTKKSFSGLLEKNPYIDKLWLLEDSLWNLLNQLKKQQFDVIIDLHHNLRTFLVKSFLGVTAYSYYKANVERFFLVFFKKDIMPKTHVAERYMETLKALNIVYDGKGLDYFLKENEIASHFPLEKGSYVVWILGAKFKTKALPPDRIIEALKSMQRSVVLIGGSDTENEAAYICNKIQVAFNGCGKYSFDESAWIIKHASDVYTNDTGMMHIAAALKKKVHVFWGSSLPEFRFTPFEVPYNSYEVKNLHCRPCSKIGYNACPKGHFKCMNNIELPEIR